MSSSASITAPVIVGSSSKWRAKVLRSMGLNIVSQMNPDIDEYSVTVAGGKLEDRLSSEPEKLSMAVATAKAQHLMKQITAEREKEPNSEEAKQAKYLITSDQVAFINGRIREKPKDADQCREWFAQYSAQPISVCNAVVVTNTLTGASVTGTAIASQLFLPTPAKVVDDLIAKGDILSCCGGFLVDDELILPYLSTCVGTEDEIIGLPKKLLTELLTKAQQNAS